MHDDNLPDNTCQQELHATIIQRISLNTRAFVVDYCARHAHPVNASLHIVGVPMVALGIAKLCLGRSAIGCSLFVAGYICQYIGHRAQGNEVGEVMLLKKIWRTVSCKGGNQGGGQG